MTKESAESIRGAFLSLMGASAATIGLVSGLGELVTIPALALVGENGWVAACVLLVVQKFGKAIKKPAKDTVVSFAASQEGAASQLLAIPFYILSSKSNLTKK